MSREASPRTSGYATFGVLLSTCQATCSPLAKVRATFRTSSWSETACHSLRTQPGPWTCHRGLWVQVTAPAQLFWKPNFPGTIWEIQVSSVEA